ncbi:GtrA family protein [Sulfurospirillum sp. 1307]
MNYSRKYDMYHIKRFIISGGSATLCHLGTMTLLVWLGINANISTSVGVIIGAIFNYIFQYYYTFDSDEQHNTSILKYIITVSISFVSNLILFTIFHNFLQINIFVSQLLTSAIVAIQNYLIYKNFVFLRNGAFYEA